VPLLALPLPAWAYVPLDAIGAYNRARGGAAVPKAILRQGVIVPLEPLPPEWEEGTTLEVARADVPPLDIDAWAQAMNQRCADSSAEDEQIMRRAIEEHRQAANAPVRREMGLPG
jgi:hypothetical protein